MHGERPCSRNQLWSRLRSSLETESGLSADPASHWDSWDADVGVRGMGNVQLPLHHSGKCGLQWQGRTHSCLLHLTYQDSHIQRTVSRMVSKLVAWISMPWISSWGATSIMGGPPSSPPSLLMTRGEIHVPLALLTPSRGTLQYTTNSAQ